MTMQEAVHRRTCYVEGVIKCYPHETLETILDRIVKAEVCVFLEFIFYFKINSHTVVVFLLLSGPQAGSGGHGRHGQRHHFSV